MVRMGKMGLMEQTEKTEQMVAQDLQVYRLFEYENKTRFEYLFEI